MPVLNPIQPPLAADLPTNWQPNQIVPSDGALNSQPEQYGYNYLMQQVNAAQQGVNALGDAINGLPEPDEVGGYFQIPQGDNLPPASRQPNSLYGQTLTDYTGAASAASGISTLAGTGTTQMLGDVPVGTLVKININGQPTNFIVVQQGLPQGNYSYDESCDGTWFCMENIYSKQAMGSGRYESSTLKSWLNSTFFGLLDENIQAEVKPAKIPDYNSDYENKIFILNAREIGWDPLYVYSESSGNKLDYFIFGSGSDANQRRIAKYNGSPTFWVTRSKVGNGITNSNWAVSESGDNVSKGENEIVGVRPAFILPKTLYVTSDGFIATGAPPTAPASIDVTNVVSGGSATITLTAATDPDGTIASYVYERSVDGGQFVQFANINSLTQTDSVQSSWGTVAYRAAAVDDKGAQGPYVTSETYTVNTGWVIVGGPVSNLGVQDAPFVLPLVVNVTGGSGVTGINLQVLLDGAQIFNDALNHGASVALPIDTRAMASGQHEIQAIAEKADYLSASLAWYFVVPSIALPEGGYTAQLQDSSGNPIFPPTFARNVIGPNGKSVQTELDELASAHQGINGHLAFVDAVLGPNASYTLQRAASTTYAYQYFAPAAADTSSQALVSVYPAYTGTIGTLLTADAGSLTFNVPANAILALWQYVTDVTPPASTDPTVNFTPLVQPQVVTAATNTGNTASDLNAALSAMMKAFPAQNYYAITDAMDSGVTYYVVSQAIITAATPSASVAYVSSANPTTWYQGVQLTFVDTSNMPAQFSYMSSPIVTAATSANPVTAGASLNATLTAMIKAQPTYNRYLLEDGTGDLYYICSPTVITADSVSAAGVLYCTTDGTYYNGESLTLAPPPTPEVTA